MTHYNDLVHKDPNSAFGVQFSDLPGCFSAADSMDDLIGKAKDALSLWADDQIMPRGRSVEEMVPDPDVAAELAAGAFLFAVNFI